MPSVSTLCMNFGVTGMAERHQIVIPVIAAFCQRLDVMHLLRFGKLAFLLALFTKRVCIHVAVTDSLPCPTIFAFDSGVSVIFFIPLILQPLMFLTKPAIRQLWAAGIRTRPFRFPWHFSTSLGIRKAHRIAPMRLFCILLRYCNDNTDGRCHSVPKGLKVFQLLFRYREILQSRPMYAVYRAF